MGSAGSVINFLLDILFPRRPYCILCDAKLATAELNICRDCENKILPLVEPLCRKCGKPLSVYIQRNSEGFLCNDCKLRHHYFEEARAFGSYEGNLKELINRFKYCRKLNLSDFLSKKMLQFLDKLPWPTVDFIVPVPLHIKRERERGFNQARLLAQGISRKTDVPVLNALNRIKPTEHQTLLDKDLRRENLQGAFGMARGVNVRGKTLLLIDDVYTTGATVDSCAKVLIEAEAVRVFVLTCARG